MEAYWKTYQSGKNSCQHRSPLCCYKMDSLRVEYYALHKYGSLKFKKSAVLCYCVIDQEGTHWLFIMETGLNLRAVFWEL
jgi:hypothetical protein